ncbi:protein transport protein SEC31-like [Amphibalanus amphitrite]|uniref:protein transport protein SEC31-like n=1 Tax=Amphibalanus amphitrite TaxID=1232801 RepID=UPI001C911AF3|nr:protein transport protein SEC31-like [Amphibalanus amphitrite]
MTIIQELTALLERQVKRAADADKRLERLERLLTREPSAGTDATTGVSESGAERGADGSVGPAAAARRTVCLPVSATPTAQPKSASTCHDRAECSVHDSDLGAVSRRLEDFELTLKYAVNHAGGDTCRAAGAICRACGEPGHFEIVCHQRADRPVATSAATKVRDSPVVAPVTVAAGTAVLPPPADTGQAGHTALQPAELSDAADVHGACPPPAGGWPAQTMDVEAAPDKAVSSPQADTGRTGSTAAQPTEPVGATASYGASPPPAGGPAGAAEAYGASPPPVGGIPTPSTGQGTAAGPAVSSPPADTGQIESTAGQSSGPADTHGASLPPAGGLQTLSTAPGAAAGPAVSPPPVDTGQTDCSVTQPTVPGETDDAYGASPPLVGGPPTQSRDREEVVSDAVSPLQSDMGQTDCAEDDACLAPLVDPVQGRAGDAAGCDPWPPPDTGAPPTGDLPGDNGRARCGRRNKRPPP